MKKPTTKAKRAAAKAREVERVKRRVNLSELLVEFRTRVGFNQSEAAVYLGVEQPQVSRWENGQLCSVPLVGRLLEIGIQASVPMVKASLILVAPEPRVALGIIGSVVKVDDSWWVNPPRTVGRLAAVVSLVSVFEPGALAVLDTPINRKRKEELEEKLDTARTFARLAREQGLEEKAVLWQSRVEEYERMQRES